MLRRFVNLSTVAGEERRQMGCLGGYRVLDWYAPFDFKIRTDTV